MGHTTDREGETASGPGTPRPPRTFTDASGRSVTVRTVRTADREALVGMYDGLDQTDRAQGLPPLTTAGIESWLDDILDEGCHLLAENEGSVVGHACLVPGGPGGHELAIFVASSHQGAGIGKRLLETLLEHGRSTGVDAVWLTVHRSNVVARNLYESTGFEPVEGAEPLTPDVEMRRPL
jgi:ribosomal protein S18 acetylase RimI-like enzyme